MSISFQENLDYFSRNSPALQTYFFRLYVVCSVLVPQNSLLTLPKYSRVLCFSSSPSSEERPPRSAAVRGQKMEVGCQIVTVVAIRLSVWPKTELVGLTS
jgi:hypothetical protein